MIDPSQRDIERVVLYRQRYQEDEPGVIVGWNDAYVHVLFRSSLTPQACRRQDLYWEHEA